MLNTDSQPTSQEGNRRQGSKQLQTPAANSSPKAADKRQGWQSSPSTRFEDRGDDPYAEHEQAPWFHSQPWFEKYDFVWIYIGYLCVLVLTLLLPLALTFGFKSLLWMWWVMVLIMYVYTQGMIQSNRTVTVQRAATFLLLLVIVGAGYAIESLFYVETGAVVVICVVQLVLVTLVMLIHPQVVTVLQALLHAVC